MNNLNSFYNNIDAILNDSAYYDMELIVDSDVYNLSCGGDGIIDDGLAIWIDVNDSGSTLDYNGLSLISLTCLSGGTIVTSGFTIYDIGLTGIDNGLVDSLTGETMSFISGGTCYLTHKVSGDTYSYDVNEQTDFSGKYYALCGGFYQGFFKLEGYPFEIIPTRNANGWSAELIISTSASCINSTGVTLNDVYSNNSGFFFFMGTRAENKFHNVFDGESGKTTTSGEPLQPQSAITTTSSFDNSFTSSICDTETTTTVTIPDPNDDLIDNAIGFRITPDYRIGYRQITSSGSCVDDVWVSGLTITEEYSDNVIFSGNSQTNWLYITITYCTEVYDECDLLSEPQRVGKLIFWVNGRRIFVVDDVNELMFKGLNTHKEKQQGVPYNISIGGGTQGLIESQTFGGPDANDIGMTMEQNFAGTFIGGFSQFRYYTKCLDVTEIRNNYYYEQDRYRLPDTFGGRKINFGKLDCE